MRAKVGAPMLAKPLRLLLLLSLAACNRAPAVPAGRAALLAAMYQAEQQGAVLYMKYCALCHGSNLRGYAADNAPSLVSPSFRESVNDAFLRTAIAYGRPGTAMAGYGQAVNGPLSPAQLDSLVVFLRAGEPPRIALPEPPFAGDANRGAALFAQTCATCHGTPVQRATAVHLFNPALLATASDGFLRHAVERGRQGTKMEPFAGKLAPGQISDVVAYLRSSARPVPPPPQPLMAPPQLPPQPALLPLTGPVVQNPGGRAASFTLRDGLYVPVAQAGEALANKRRLVFVDARTPSDYLRLHIQDAVSIPYYDMRDLAKIPKDDNTWVIAYCACPHHVSGVVVEELRKRGYTHTAVLDEGVFDWVQKGFPVVAAQGQLPVAGPPPLPGTPWPGPAPLPAATHRVTR